MAYVKLDCGMLDSTIWFDREAREVFITALLMAVPTELTEPTPQIATDTLDETGFVIPPGWYGFVAAAGPGIVRRAGLEQEVGMEALKRLAAPEENSRTPDFDGRRLVRIDGGYLVLNLIKYRDRDHTSAVRSKRYRERKRHGVTSLRDGVALRDEDVSPRDITQAEAEAEAEALGISIEARASKKKGDGAVRFAPPTLSEIEEFVTAKGIDVDPLKFFSYYESIGWRVGKNPMRKWKMAAWNWSRGKA